MGVPLNHPFLDGIFPKKTIQLLGHLLLWKTPISISGILAYKPSYKQYDTPHINHQYDHRWMVVVRANPTKMDDLGPYFGLIYLLYPIIIGD